MPRLAGQLKPRLLSSSSPCESRRCVSPARDFMVPLCCSRYRTGLRALRALCALTLRPPLLPRHASTVTPLRLRLPSASPPWTSPSSSSNFLEMLCSSCSSKFIILPTSWPLHSLLLNTHSNTPRFIWPQFLSNCHIYICTENNSSPLRTK